MRQPSTDSDVPNSTKTAIVTFYWGPDEYSFVTAGRSVCHVASIAQERFSSDWWQGPVPTPETVVWVCQVGSARQYRVTVQRVKALLGSG